MLILVFLPKVPEKQKNPVAFITKIYKVFVKNSTGFTQVVENMT